jgi:hypothetical protein
MLGNSWVVAQLATSRGDLSSIESVLVKNDLFFIYSGSISMGIPNVFSCHFQANFYECPQEVTPRLQLGHKQTRHLKVVIIAATTDTSEYRGSYRLKPCIMLQSGNCVSEGSGATGRDWCSYRDSHHFDTYIYIHNLKHSSLKALFLCFHARKQNLRDQNTAATCHVHIWFMHPTISCMHVWVVNDHPINNGRTTVRQAHTQIKL